MPAENRCKCGRSCVKVPCTESNQHYIITDIVSQKASMPLLGQLSKRKKKNSSTSSDSSQEKTQKKAPTKTPINMKPSQQSVKRPASPSSTDSDSDDDKPTNKALALSKGTSLLLVQNLIIISLSLV